MPASPFWHRELSYSVSGLIFISFKYPLLSPLNLLLTFDLKLFAIVEKYYYTRN